MKKLRLMCDYFCYPIWHDDGAETEEFGGIDPRTLPITAALVEALASWSESFDRGLDMADPAGSRWAPGEQEEFLRVGRQLLVRIQGELGASFVVRNGFEFPSMSALNRDGVRPPQTPDRARLGVFNRWWLFLPAILLVSLASVAMRGH